MTQQATPLDGLSTGARDLLSLILDYLTADRPVPPQPELARLLGVQKRTIERWIRELRSADIIHTKQGKRGLNYRSCQIDTIGSSIAAERGKPRKLPIQTTDRRAMEEGVLIRESDRIETSSPPTPPAKTPQTGTGRWLVGLGFWPAIAAELERGPLAAHSYEVVKADYERLSESGKGIGAIVQHWRAVGIVTAETVTTRSPWSKEAAAWREWTEKQRPALAGEGEITA